MSVDGNSAGAALPALGAAAAFASASSSSAAGDGSGVAEGGTQIKVESTSRQDMTNKLATLRKQKLALDK
eukprot:12426658-Karenia_brevis.AAC.1